jgi:hypothetical protein
VNWAQRHAEELIRQAHKGHNGSGPMSCPRLVDFSLRRDLKTEFVHGRVIKVLPHQKPVRICRPDRFAELG